MTDRYVEVPPFLLTALAGSLVPMRGAAISLPETSESLDAIPEDYRSLYTQEGEGDDVEYRLSPAAAALVQQYNTINTRLDEFRGNNRSMKAKLEKLEQQLSKFDAEKYEQGLQALEKLSAIDDAELLKGGKVDEVVEKRVNTRIATMKRDFDSQIAAKDQAIQEAQAETKSLRTRLGELLIDTQVQNAVNEVGKPRNGAMTDIVARARGTFRITDTGDVEPRDSTGEMVYGKDSKPLSFKEWASQLLTNAPHLFEPTKGGGAGGGKPGDGANRVRVIPKDPVLIGKHAKDIQEGRVVVEGTV